MNSFEVVLCARRHSILCCDKIALSSFRENTFFSAASKKVEISFFASCSLVGGIDPPDRTSREGIGLGIYTQTNTHKQTRISNKGPEFNDLTTIRDFGKLYTAGIY